MAIESDHIDLANRNHRTLLYLVSDYRNHPEWVATVAFYKGLHIVEAVFHHKWGRDSRSHDDRMERVKRLLPLKYFQQIEALYQKSRIARYLEDSASTTSYRRFTDHMSAELVVSELVGKRLVTLENMSLPMLSDDARGKLVKIHVPSLPSMASTTPPQ